MSNPSRDKGTKWESRVVDWLHGLGFSKAERKAQGPEGDITGVPEWTIEAKNWKRIALAEFIKQLEAEVAKTGTDFSAVVIHRPGKASVDDAYVVMPGYAWAKVLDVVRRLYY